MEDASRVGEARRYAVQLAEACGFDDVEAGRVALIVTELGTNLVRHARAGRLLVTGRPACGEVDVLAIDEGPGIADIDRSMDDGFSTGTTPGTGLGAVRRLATHFDVHSSVPQGTVMVARVRSAKAPVAADRESGFSFGAIALPAPGERVCGDGWAVAVHGSKATMMVADGLGHGPDAAVASAAALAAFAEDPMAVPRVQIDRTHRRLRGTRGAAVAVFHADASDNTVRSSGAGNVVGRIVSGISDRTLLTQHGTAGVTIRSPEEASTPWAPHGLLVVCSDGIATRWGAETLLPVLGRDPLLAAGILLRDQLRGKDDATVAVLRRND